MANKVAVALVLSFVSSTARCEVTWAILGRSLALNCESPSSTCSWSDPSCQAVQDLPTDRIQMLDDSGCRLELHPVQRSDEGVWICFSGFDTASTFNVSIALEPESFTIEAVEETSEVRCVVKKAKPRPKISWFVDDVIVEERKTKFYEGIENVTKQMLEGSTVVIF